MDKAHSLTRIASTAVSAWRFVDANGGHAANAMSAIGISEQAAAIGSAYSVINDYSAPVEAAETLSAGDLVKPAMDGSGRAAKGTSGDCCGRVLSGASVGKLAEVRFLELAASAAVSGSVTAIQDAQLVSNWSISGTVTGTITNSTDPVMGQVLNINASTAGARLSARREFGQSMKQFAGLSLYLKKDANLSVLDVELFVGDYSIAKRTALNKAVGNLDAGVWQRIAIPLSDWENAYLITPTDTAFLTGIRIGATPVGGQTTVLQVAGIQLHDVPAGTVSFFFDDGRLDTFTEAYRLLKQYGFPAAVAPEYTRLGTSPSYSLMTEAQVDELYFDGGWDVCGHHYFNMTAQSEATAVGIYQACKNWMRSRRYTRGDHIWAWPGGARDAASQAIANRYWQVTRRVGSVTYAGIPGTFDPAAPPNWYVSSAQDAAQVLALVDKVKAYGGSLVLTFHSLVNNKVAAEDFLISDFATLIQGIAARGVSVVPPSKIWTKQ